MEQKTIYLDNAATTKTDPAVVEAMIPYFTETYAVASSQFSHTPGILAREALDRAREISGIPFVITSGYRCISHNYKIGGVSESAHLSGYAVDISVIDSEDRLAVLLSLFQCGFKRIGISKTFIHADIDPTKPKCIWLY